MSASVCWAEIYKSFLQSLTEVKRNRTFDSLQRTDERQSAVSLIQFTYDLVFSPPRDEESNDLIQTPRVSLPRANILMPLLRLMRCRATGLLKWAKTEVYHIRHTLPRA